MKIIYAVAMYVLLPIFYVVWLMESFKLGNAEIPLTALGLLLSGAIGYYAKHVRTKLKK